MNVFGEFMKKEKSQVENSMFAKHGFVKVKDKNKKIFVTVNEIKRRGNIEICCYGKLR